MAQTQASQKDGVDMRERLLEEATHLFAQRGFDGAPLSAIAGAVGITKPSLLYHFPTKAALRQAVLDRLLARWGEVLPNLLQAATTGGRRFRALIDEIVAFFVEDPDRARLLLREMLDRPDHMHAMLREHVAPWVTILADYIRMGQQEGRVWADLDPEAYLLNVVHQIVAGIAVSGVFARLYDEPGDAPTQEAAARHLEELVRMARASLFLPRDARPPTPRHARAGAPTPREDDHE